MFRKLSDDADESVIIFVDDVPVAAESGESVAAALLRQSPMWARRSPVSGAARAPFCMMGVCFDCLAEVDGEQSVQTCLVPVQAGMKVVRQSVVRKL